MIIHLLRNMIQLLFDLVELFHLISIYLLLFGNVVQCIRKPTEDIILCLVHWYYSTCCF